MRKYVIGRVTVKPGRRDEYLGAAASYTATSRGERGCLYYHQAADAMHPDGVIVVEGWDSPEAHAAHTGSEHFAAFGPVFGGYVLSAHFEEMNVGDVHDVVVGGK